jgi:alkylation response protein AidB-like acyl-CoA dehydrogenase
VTAVDEEVHAELRSVARDLLGKARAPDWGLLADAGWLGLEVPEALDGAGAAFAEVAVVLEEMGRVAAVGPYLGTAVLGVATLNRLAPSPGRDALLRLVAAGDRKVAVALDTDDSGLWISRWSEISRARNDGGFRFTGGRLHGKAAFVPDAPDADRLLLPAIDADGVPCVAVVHTGDEAPAGLTVEPQPVLDATRRLGQVRADGVEVPDAAIWRFAGDPEQAIQRLHDRAALAVACDSLGLSTAMLDATVAYAGVRQQFGRPIGSFQAVKHACADMLVQVTVARELIMAAVRAVVADEAATATVTVTAAAAAAAAVAMAKSYATASAVDVVGKALQLHGGIGYTWESGIHVHLKRAALNRSLFGSPAAHRRRLAQRYRTD